MPMSGGYWYGAPGRSAMMLEAGGRCDLIKSTISLRTQSCR